jgi:hypothetical protein
MQESKLYQGSGIRGRGSGVRGSQSRAEVPSVEQTDVELAFRDQETNFLQEVGLSSGHFVCSMLNKYRRVCFYHRLGSGL